MAKLFVGNLTKQHHDFVYLTPESGRRQMQTIPVGGQAEIYGEASPEFLGAIIAQHERYGIVPVASIDQSRGQFVGLCYQFNKPIDIRKIEKGVAQNMDVVGGRGVETRKMAALATFDRRDGRPAIGDVEIEEVVPTGDTGLHERIQVIQQGSEPINPRTSIDAPRAAKGRGRKAS